MNYLRSENKQKENKIKNREKKEKKKERKKERQSIYTPLRIGSPPKSGGVQLIMVEADGLPHRARWASFETFWKKTG